MHESKSARHLAMVQMIEYLILLLLFPLRLFLYLAFSSMFLACFKQCCLFLCTAVGLLYHQFAPSSFCLQGWLSSHSSTSISATARVPCSRWPTMSTTSSQVSSLLATPTSPGSPLQSDCRSQVRIAISYASAQQQARHPCPIFCCQSHGTYI